MIYYNIRFSEGIESIITLKSPEIFNINNTYKYIVEHFQIKTRDLYFLNQIHSNDVIDLDRIYKSGMNKIINADGMTTRDPSKVLVIRTADCVPVIIHGHKRIAIIHSGREGTFKKIIIQALNFFNDTYNLRVYIGPAIGKCCYQVSRSIAEKFGNAIVKNNSYYIDIRERIYKDLIDRGGVNKKNIFIDESCTCCDNEKYYSYRRNGTHCRMLTAVRLKA